MDHYCWQNNSVRGGTMKLKFKTSKALRQVCMTAFQNDLKLPYGQGPANARGIWLVNDAGVYIMPANSKGKPEHIAYAQGFRRDGIFGDDFAEFIPLSINQLDRIINGCKPLEIELNDDSMRVTA